MTHISDKDDAGGESRSEQSTSPAPRTISVAGHRLESRDLFIGTREVVIHHGGEIYRLRLTSQNKLILTK
ncbi:MAG: hemin uptake protein HemP [Xanthobacteraceae bacterium]